MKPPAGEPAQRPPADAASKPKRPRGQVHILRDQCKGCGYCVEFCPRHVLGSSSSFNKKGYHPPQVDHPDECTACRLCQLMCPDFAIFVVPEGGEGDDGAR